MTVEFLDPGVWGIVATPFAGADLDVDRASLTALVQLYRRAGAAGLTLLGVFGEASKLDTAERRAVIETVAEAVDLPLVVGVQALSTKPVIEEVGRLQDILGDRLAASMIQVNSADATTLARHLNTIHDATGVGIVLQDYPVTSGVTISRAAAADAVAAVDAIVGIKAESAPTPAMVSTLSRATKAPVFGGLGGITLIDELNAGAAGVMTGFSYPEGLIACVRAYGEGGFAAARAAIAPYLPLINFEQQPGIALSIRKHCLAYRGVIAESAIRAPGAAMPPELVPLLEQQVAILDGLEAA